MVSDQEPRYRLVDDEGNIVGSLYGKADGSIAIQETASGSDREVTLAPDGTFSAPSVETELVSAERAVLTGSNWHRKERVGGVTGSDSLPVTVDLQDDRPHLIIAHGRLDAELTLRVNGDSSADYTYVTKDLSTFTENSSQNEWVLGGRSGVAGITALWVVSNPRTRPHIHGNGIASTSASFGVLDTGFVGDSMTLSSLEFNSDESLDSDFRLDVIELGVEQ